ncbi:cupredoxin domain-containing protein [Brevibacillus massiliensis]|uniref:cupredoxin domain-containing protein n=1 Tax=Brevibacillus massiliensis TaxID=1118054 RepID=UPI0003142F48|nr:cupredoxin domain-containing protein [Brevibacillus massiliensis]
MSNRFPRLYLVGYPLFALGMILSLLALHSFSSYKISTASTGVKLQSVTITSSGFLPQTLKYHEGEKISLVVVNTDQRPHNLVIKSLQIESPPLKQGEATTLSFTAAKKGAYSFYSDAPGYPEAGYRGTLVIE